MQPCPQLKNEGRSQRAGAGFWTASLAPRFVEETAAPAPLRSLVGGVGKFRPVQVSGLLQRLAYYQRTALRKTGSRSFGQIGGIRSVPRQSCKFRCRRNLALSLVPGAALLPASLKAEDAHGPSHPLLHTSSGSGSALSRSHSRTREMPEGRGTSHVAGTCLTASNSHQSRVMAGGVRASACARGGFMPEPALRELDTRVARFPRGQSVRARSHKLSVSPRHVVV